MNAGAEGPARGGGDSDSTSSATLKGRHDKNRNIEKVEAFEIIADDKVAVNTLCGHRSGNYCQGHSRYLGNVFPSGDHHRHRGTKRVAGASTQHRNRSWLGLGGAQVEFCP